MGICFDRSRNAYDFYEKTTQSPKHYPKRLPKAIKTTQKHYPEKRAGAPEHYPETENTTQKTSQRNCPVHHRCHRFQSQNHPKGFGRTTGYLRKYCQIPPQRSSGPADYYPHRSQLRRPLEGPVPKIKLSLGGSPHPLQSGESPHATAT